MMSVTLPLVSRSVPALHLDTKLFVLVKVFASGVILATGYMHVLPDSFECLTSVCLPEKPWSNFPFTTFISMMSAVGTLMIDSYMMSGFKKYSTDNNGIKNPDPEMKIMGHCHGDVTSAVDDCLPHVEARVLELGIVVHSVVIVLSMGASDNMCTIRPLVAALCFFRNWIPFFVILGLGCAN
ncbi:Fe(2+) transport protein 1-like protein [Tanacetum coccineum]